MRVGFDNKKYLELQKKKITERIKKFNNKLYIEFGGKLFDDHHAARVLPGFDRNVKIDVLKLFKDKIEVLFVISAKDIEEGKIRSDLGIAYENDILRQMDKLKKLNILADKIVITQFENEPAARLFKNKMEKRNIKVFFHTYTKGYPTDIDTIVSKDGYGANPYIKTDMPIVLVTAPGPGSGKLATCLSQIYHEFENGITAGYAKYETFPVWNLPLKHPINLAYEAATADLSDVNMIDSFHLEKYGETTVNYNRDLAVFPILKTILTKIYGKNIYNSPTDMGVNMVGYAITDDKIVMEASRSEIIRRYYNELCESKKGKSNERAIKKLELLMSEEGINSKDRIVIKEALNKFKKKKKISIAIKLQNDKIITGRNTDIMTASASVVLNSIKYLSGVKDNVHLISPVILEPIITLKKQLFDNGDTLLNLHDILMALSISRATNPIVDEALHKLSELSSCDAHASHIITNDDVKTFKSLGVFLTQEPDFYSSNLYDEK
jgi:Uncharacterized protein conserved in bacteria